MLRPLPALLLASAALSLAAPPALAIVMPGPIRVHACVPQMSVPPQSFHGIYGRTYVQPGMPSSVMVHYTNDGELAAKSVEFGLVVDGRIRSELRDVGSFARGAEIRHSLGVNRDVAIGRTNPNCVPLRVVFSDGSVWKNPDPPPAD